MWIKENPCALLVGMQTETGTVEHSIEDPQKVKIESPNDPAIPLLRIYTKPKTKKQNQNISAP